MDNSSEKHAQTPFAGVTKLSHSEKIRKTERSVFEVVIASIF
jgi:hypothetical protein